MLFPRASRGVEAVMLNTAGGITGGDRFEISAEAGHGTHLTITTQAAERIYRTSTDQAGRMQTTLTVDAGGSLFWMPQETILFDGSALRRRLRADLAPSARFLLVEPVVFGRTASGESLRTASFKDHVQITRDGVPIYSDGICLRGDISAQMGRAAVGGGAGAVASVVLVHPAAATYLDPLRALLPDTAGASLLADDVLVMRVLAPDSYVLRQCLVPALTLLTDNALPRNWRL